MASGPPSLQSLCVIKLIDGKSDEEITKIKAPSLITDELELVKDKIKKDSYKSDHLLNLDFISSIVKDHEELRRYKNDMDFRAYVCYDIEGLIKKMNCEKDEIKEIAKHLNYGKWINNYLAKKYMITNEDYPFVKNFNKNLKLNDFVKSHVFGDIHYRRNPAKHGIFKLRDFNNYEWVKCEICGKFIRNFHEACTFCKKQRYKICECSNNNDDDAEKRCSR